jgi:hypothetical protein
MQEIHMLEYKVRRTPITDSSAWMRADIERDPRWLFVLEPQWIAEIDRAVGVARQRGCTLETLRRDDFPLPTLAVELNRRVWGELAHGVGFSVMRGLPAARYSDREMEMIVWGMGLHIGKGISQNARGDLLGHVFDQGVDYETRNVRGYQTNHQLKFHNDSGDVLGLMCLRRAREGGESSVSSATSVFNCILAERPDLLPLFFRGFEFDRRGEGTPFQTEVSDKIPIYAEVDGDLSVRYVRQAIKTARVKTGVAFTSEELAALDFFDSVAAREDVCLSMMLEPGDMQWVNNHLILHSRTEYQDWPEPGRERHMLRLWLKIHGYRKLDMRQMDQDPLSGWSRRDGMMPSRLAEEMRRNPSAIAADALA